MVATAMHGTPTERQHNDHHSAFRTPSSMPRLSERQQFIVEIIDFLAILILEEDDDEDIGFCVLKVDGMDLTMDTPAEELAELLQLVTQNRYLVPRERISLSSDFAYNVFPRLSDEDFKQQTRATRSTFCKILTAIQGHTIFSNASQNPQAPVWLQLAVALDRLGTNGNGASLGCSRKLWGLRKGTVPLYTARVIIALNDLRDEFVAWPDSAERRRISRRMDHEGFPGCVGFIDGTTIPLAQKPAVDGECYFDRKHRYSVNAQVVCDDRRRIIAFYSGWSGSCGDIAVYHEMRLATDADKWRFFDCNQYLVADSAYPADLTHHTIIPAYKTSHLGNEKEEFNKCVAHVRVVNKHSIGVLKGRWSSLRELRVQIRTSEDMNRILLWLTACVVLHNMSLLFGDGWPSDEECPDTYSDSDEPASDSDDEDPYAFRRHIKAKAIARGRARGGILCQDN